MELYIVAYRNEEGSLKIILNLELNDLKLYIEAYENGNDEFFHDGTSFDIRKTKSLEIFDVDGWANLSEPSELINKIYKAYDRNEDFYEYEIILYGKKVTRNFINNPYGYKRNNKEKIQNVSMENYSAGRIFISHSTKDKDIVTAFVDKILILSFGLKREQIFCSSVTGTGIKSGADFKNAIKDEILNANAVIQIISKDFKQSEVCLNEMGAAWVLSDTIIPLVIQPQNYDVGFLNCSTQQLKINDEQNLHQLYNDHKGVLFPPTIDTGVFNEKIKEFIYIIDSCIKRKKGNSFDIDLFYNEEVEIQGEFKIGIFTGPPGYGENPESDSYHRYYYIELDPAVNVLSNGIYDIDDEPRNFSHFGVDKIQLLIQNFELLSPIESYKNMRVSVFGEFFSGYTGWHQTKVLINVSRLKLVE